MQKQVVVIHGGNTFRSYKEYILDLKNKDLDFERLQQQGWKKTLQERLGNSVQVIAPKMPNPSNAKYLEWSIWFQKIVPFLQDKVILVGHSLGGIFLAKYLAENSISQKIRATFLLAAPFVAHTPEEFLADFVLPKNLDLLQKQGGEILLYHSTDDPVVAFADLEEYAKKLPQAKKRVFHDKQHFNQEEFPKLVEDIRTFLF